MTDQKDKPVLDEQTFDRLLEAAYVIQQHHRKLRDAEQPVGPPDGRLPEQRQEPARSVPLRENQIEPEEKAHSVSDYTLTLAEIVEAQRQIQTRNLELEKALAVVADKVARVTRASGAAVGILEDTIVRYRAAAGTPAVALDSEVPLATAICAASVRTGQVIRTENVNAEILFDPEPCRKRGILSLVVVPIYYDGDIAGALEVYFDKIQGFTEQDIHTCQLMAGLVTEAMGRDAEVKLKISMAAERSTMLAAIEKIQPNLAALAEQSNAVPATTCPCWKCGNMLLAEEQFCGKCGAPRVTDDEFSTTQSKLASAWHMQETDEDSLEDGLEDESVDKASPALETPLTIAKHDTDDSDHAFEEDPGEWNGEHEADTEVQEHSPLAELEERVPQVDGSFSLSADEDENVTTESVSSKAHSEVDAEVEQEGSVEAPSTALARAPQEDEAIVWSSAAKARDFLESLSPPRSSSALARFWRSRRGDFYLAVAVILMVVVIRWGLWSNHSVSATGGGTAVPWSAARHKPAPDADLSLFDKLLLSLGLAEAPDAAPEYKGNPDTHVWVDLHTALYYCPGSDLYGKTPKGRESTQREAQLDQFEPAYRKPCD